MSEAQRTPSAPAPAQVAVARPTPTAPSTSEAGVAPARVSTAADASASAAPPPISTHASPAEPKFGSVEEELAAYREVYRRLTAEVVRSTADVQRLQIQRRHLLEEIMGNIRRDGGYFPGTTWAKQAQNYAKRSQAEWSRQDRQRKVDRKRAASAKRHRDRLDRMSAASQKQHGKGGKKDRKEKEAREREVAAAAARQPDPAELKLATEIGLPKGWSARSSKNGTYTIYSPNKKQRFMSKKAAFDHCGIGISSATSAKPMSGDNPTEGGIGGDTATSSSSADGNKKRKLSNAVEDPKATTIAAAEAAARAAAATMLASMAMFSGTAATQTEAHESTAAAPHLPSVPPLPQPEPEPEPEPAPAPAPASTSAPAPFPASATSESKKDGGELA